MFRAFAVFLWVSSTAVLMGQVRPRVTRPVNDAAIIRLPRSAHPLANPANDAGRTPGNLRMERMLLLLGPSPEQEAALNRLLADQQDPASPRYHQWLTPEEFGSQFGAADQDIAATTAWLESHGLQVNQVAKGRATIDFSGSARQVETAFHTEMHRYSVNGAARIGNSGDIAIPDALAPVVRGVVSLHSFPRHTLHHRVEQTIGGSHFMVPYDFAAIYNVAPLWNNGFDGTGQTIAIAGRSNIRTSDLTAFRSLTGLPANAPQIIVNGVDPGNLGGDEELEADLDVQWSGAVAKGATVKFVISKSTTNTDGIDLSSQYIVDNNLASVMSISFGSCEVDNGSIGNQFFHTLWAQAAAQGISVFVASGDTGSAGCDLAFTTGTGGSNTTKPASRGFGVNALASTPHNVAVGGTRFDDTASPSTWWNATNDANLASAKGYIPEVVWNDSSFTAPGASGNSLWAGSGGVSKVWPTPYWQIGNGVPVTDPDGSGKRHRYLPDVSLSGAGHVGYRVYQLGSFRTVGGTSAGSPAMAGIMAVINQYAGGRTGNPNPRLYGLAAKSPSPFHDVTSGTNAVPCSGGSANCSAEAPSTNVGVLTGYNAGPGYDLATGWGSMDVHVLAANWALSGPATHLSIAAPASAAVGVPFNITVTALDGLNNTAPLYNGTVHFTSTDPAAILPADVALSAGKATVAVTLKTAGSRTVTAADTANSSISGSSAAIAVSGLPDLLITAFTAGTAAAPGGSLNASVTVANQGSGAAGPFAIGFYFGTTASLISAASPSSCPVQGLAAGASVVCSATVTVPANLPAGSWYLFAAADAAGAIVESNEANNARIADTGAVAITSRTPAAVSVAPASGSGTSQPFTFTFSDPDGRQDLDVVNVLINNFLDGRNACYLAYSRPSNTLFLVGNDGGSLLPGLVLNGAGSVSNGQCTVNGAGSSASGGGNTLTLALSISFSASFAGNKVVYLAARDTVQNNSGWQALGTWGVPVVTTFPTVTGINPATGSGGGQAFTFTFTDNKGFQDLGVTNVLINNFLDGRHACYLAYSRPLNLLYLVDDAGTALLPAISLGGSGSVGNSQCTVSSAGSSASGAGNTLTLTVNIAFSSAFAGNRVMYLAARDTTEANNSGWQAIGSWIVP